MGLLRILSKLKHKEKQLRILMLFVRWRCWGRSLTRRSAWQGTR
jgi:hypothetical protein